MKKKSRAAALEYRKKDSAPRITAHGKGKVAERIIKLAEENNLPLYEDADLVEALTKLDINELIPPSLYQVVAEVLAFVYELNRERKRELS